MTDANDRIVHAVPRLQPSRSAVRPAVDEELKFARLLAVGDRHLVPLAIGHLPLSLMDTHPADVEGQPAITQEPGHAVWDPARAVFGESEQSSVAIGFKSSGDGKVGLLQIQGIGRRHLQPGMAVKAG